jgi:hypothetical protein
MRTAETQLPFGFAVYFVALTYANEYMLCWWTVEPIALKQLKASIFKHANNHSMSCITAYCGIPLYHVTLMFSHYTIYVAIFHHMKEIYLSDICAIRVLVRSVNTFFCFASTSRPSSCFRCLVSRDMCSFFCTRDRRALRTYGMRAKTHIAFHGKSRIVDKCFLTSYMVRRWSKRRRASCSARRVPADGAFCMSRTDGRLWWLSSHHWDRLSFTSSRLCKKENRERMTKVKPRQSDEAKWLEFRGCRYIRSVT